MGESIYDEDVITKNDYLDLSDVVFAYIKNEGSNSLKFGLQTVAGNKEIPIQLGSTKLKKGTKIKITFTNGKGQLYYRLIRASNCKCESNNPQ
jgi:hypothetical protein